MGISMPRYLKEEGREAIAKVQEISRSFTDFYGAALQLWGNDETPRPIMIQDIPSILSRKRNVPDHQHLCFVLMDGMRWDLWECIKADFFDKGRTVDDILKTPFFTKLRDWQKGYSYEQSADSAGNEIVPCPIRDHHREFNKIARESNAIPVGKSAEKAIKDEQYIEELNEVGRKADEATADIWKQQYQKA